MASPGQLVKAIAEVLGQPEVSVTQHDRNLVAAGLRTKGGRGNSAASMTARDATNLLIAVAGSSAIKDTVQTVREFGSLPARSAEAYGEKGSQGTDETGRWRLDGFPITELQQLRPGHTFDEAIEGLLIAVVSGGWQNAIKAKNDRSPYGIPDIHVRFMGPYAQAAIDIYGAGYTERMTYTHIPTDMEGVQAWAEAHMKTADLGDLSQIREFKLRTIMTVGKRLQH